MILRRVWRTLEVSCLGDKFVDIWVMILDELLRTFVFLRGNNPKKYLKKNYNMLAN